MRNAFIEQLYTLAQQDERIVLLTADLGYSVIEKFAQNFPNRFYNVGIAEQNMIGVATGLAEAGFIPFCYSIAPFTLLRPYEFIKNGPVLHNLKVRLVGIGGGFEYGDLGYTHYCLEDIGVSRVFPNLQSYFPINSLNASDMLSKTYDLDSPIYYRIGKNKNSITESIIKSYSDKGVESLHYNEKYKTAVIALSSTVDQAEKAFHLASENQKAFNLYALTKINPVSQEEIKEILLQHNKIITVESHYLSGGLGSILAEIIADNHINCQLIRLAVDREVDSFIGSQNFMEEKYNIDYKAILKNL